MKFKQIETILRKYHAFNESIFNKDIINHYHHIKQIKETEFSDFIAPTKLKGEENFDRYDQTCMYRVNPYQYRLILELITRNQCQVFDSPLHTSKPIFFYPDESYLMQLNSLISKEVLYQVIYVNEEDKCYVVLVSEFSTTIFSNPNVKYRHKFFGIDIYDFLS